MTEKEFEPKIDFLCVDCPVYNGEFMLCQITSAPCPKQYYSGSNDLKTDFPDDCPAKDGVIIKRKI